MLLSLTTWNSETPKFFVAPVKYFSLSTVARAHILSSSFPSFRHVSQLAREFSPAKPLTGTILLARRGSAVEDAHTQELSKLNSTKTSTFFSLSHQNFKFVFQFIRPQRELSGAQQAIKIWKIVWGLCNIKISPRLIHQRRLIWHFRLESVCFLISKKYMLRFFSAGLKVKLTR